MCDFPEFCNGIAEFCVPDMKSADLELCNNKTAFCYQGICQDTDKQCAELFGKCNGCIYFLRFIFKLYLFLKPVMHPIAIIIIIA